MIKTNEEDSHLTERGCYEDKNMKTSSKTRRSYEPPHKNIIINTLRYHFDKFTDTLKKH